MRFLIELLTAIGDYKPTLKYDPYEEDCCGSHDVFTVSNSGLGYSVKFVDGVTFYFSDDDGSLVKHDPNAKEL